MKRLKTSLAAVLLLVGLATVAVVTSTAPATATVATSGSPSDAYPRCFDWAQVKSNTPFAPTQICFTNTTDLYNYLNAHGLYIVATAWDTDHATNWTMDIVVAYEQGCLVHNYWLSQFGSGWDNQMEAFAAPNGPYQDTYNCDFARLHQYTDLFGNAQYVYATKVNTYPNWASSVYIAFSEPAN